MSEIYDTLQAQAAALAAVPTYGADVRLDKPPAGDDPSQMIYLEPALDSASSNGRDTISATWTAVIVADPGSMLSEALDAQDSMIVALADSCFGIDVRRQSLGDRQSWTGIMPASVGVIFSVSQPQ